MPRTLSDEDVQAIAWDVARRLPELLAQQLAPALRNTYTCQQFAAEILGGNHHPKWVRAQCRIRLIKTIRRSPYIIPGSEAARFIGR